MSARTPTSLAVHGEDGSSRETSTLIDLIRSFLSRSLRYKKRDRARESNTSPALGLRFWSLA